MAFVRRRWRAVLAPAVFSLTLLGWLGYQMFAPYGPAGTVTLTVRRGDSFSSVVAECERLRLIRNRPLFLSISRLFDLPRRMRAGFYPIRSPISLWNLVRYLSKAEPHWIRLTIWEGMMAKEVAERIEELGLGRSERFMRLVQNEGNRCPLPFPWSGPLEGLLWPDTYYFPPLPVNSEEFLLQTFIDGFLKNFYEHHLKNRKDISVQQIVTVASLVQWEVKMDEERPVVAGVIRNRLEKGIPLQIDASVLYALGKRKRRVLYEDLKVESPYNTYRRRGLPPGPICSPGIESLKAALEPAEVPYLYYVARGDGHHIFSATYEDHLKAVARYRRLMRERRDKVQREDRRSGRGGRI